MGQCFLVEQVFTVNIWCSHSLIVAVSHFLRSQPENSQRYFTWAYHYFLEIKQRDQVKWRVLTTTAHIMHHNNIYCHVYFICCKSCKAILLTYIILKSQFDKYISIVSFQPCCFIVSMLKSEFSWLDLKCNPWSVEDTHCFFLVQGVLDAGFKLSFILYPIKPHPACLLQLLF